MYIYNSGIFSSFFKKNRMESRLTKDNFRVFSLCRKCWVLLWELEGLDRERWCTAALHPRRRPSSSQALCLAERDERQHRVTMRLPAAPFALFSGIISAI